MAKRYYTLNPTDYDFDTIFDEEEITNEERDARLQSLGDPHIVHYRTKTIKSGNMLEVEIYPVWDTHKSTTRARKTKASREAQKNLNYKNAIKTVVRLVNANFTNGDVWATYTYDADHLPPNRPAAEKELTKYIRRLKYYNDKHGLPPLKYVYWTEYETDEKKGKIRVHHHLVTNFRNRDVMEELWHNSGRTQTRRLYADENEFEGMTCYCMKDPKGAKRFVASKNLTKPQITVADNKFTRRKVNRIYNGDTPAAATFEKMYKGYAMTRIDAKTSEYVSGVYMYIKMHKKRRE